MESVTPSQLATINLRFGSTAQPLKLLAFSDLASKGLCALDREATINEICLEVAKIIGIKQVEEKLIGEALQSLKTDGKVKYQSNKWSLVKEAEYKIKDEVLSFEKEIKSVLERHFSDQIDLEISKKWFMEASADFFGFYGADWVKSVSRNITTSFVKSKTVEQLLVVSIKKYSLKTYQNELITGFNAFLSSDNTLDQKVIMSLGFAMFSAQLVAADVGSDPIAIDEIRDATFILDTNVLFAIQLDVHRLAKSMNALELALKEIGSKLLFLHTTEEEYKRVYVGKRGGILSLMRSFPDVIVKNAKDDFIATAKARGCETRQDFERFFEEIKNPPRKFPSGLKISKLDDSEIEDEVKKAEKDNPLKSSIQHFYTKLKPKGWHKPKTESALKHDSSLMRVAEKIKKDDKKTWVLTLDRSLQACSVKRSGVHNIPTVLFLEGLIQILAVNNAGPTHNASDFAPLLTNIILNRCNPSENTYTPQDLQWLYSIQERVVDFTPDRIKKIVDVVTMYRLAGMSADNKKLQLAVNRAYLEEKRSFEQELENATNRVRVAEKESGDAKVTLSVTEGALKAETRVKINKSNNSRLVTSLLWRIPVALVAGKLIYSLAILSFSVLKQNELYDFVLITMTYVSSLIAFLVSPIKKYLVFRKDIDTEVDKEIKKLLIK